MLFSLLLIFLILLRAVFRENKVLLLPWRCLQRHPAKNWTFAKAVITFPFPKQQILGSSKDSADNNFKFDKNGGKLSKRVENTLRKGEIAHYAGNQHFLLFPQCFLTFRKTNFNFSVTFVLLSANAINSDHSENLSFGKELMHISDA